MTFCARFNILSSGPLWTILMNFAYFTFRRSAPLCLPSFGCRRSQFTHPSGRIRSWDSSSSWALDNSGFASFRARRICRRRFAADCLFSAIVRARLNNFRMFNYLNDLIHCKLEWHETNLRLRCKSELSTMHVRVVTYSSKSDLPQCRMGDSGDGFAVVVPKDNNL